MSALIKEYNLNKMAASLIPNLGHFKDVVSSSSFLVEKIKMLEIALNADNLDKETRTSLLAEKQMVETALTWMNAEWQ